MSVFNDLIRRLRQDAKRKAKEKKESKRAQERRLRFESESWQRNQFLARRQYDSYDDYLRHQTEKLAHVRHRLDETYADDLAEFKRRFSTCEALRETRSVLCLGARLGTEVKALHGLGHFAVGMDLNPGPGNELVLPGDFHRIVFPDGAVDAVYTNSLDHVFDFAQVMREVYRVLRSGGLFIVDHVKGYDEGFVPGNYEATHWATSESLYQRICEGGMFARAGHRNLGQFRRDEYQQMLFRKI